MSAPPEVSRNVEHHSELDVLRALAVVFMVVNHAGYKLLSSNDAEQGFAGALVFLGSFAPVLFFFVTGAGVGLGTFKAREHHGSPAFWPVANKVLLLFVADVFLSLQGGSRNWTFDFFAFIGLCVLAVWLLQLARRPVTTALVAILVLLSMRYGLAPLFERLGWTGSDTLEAKILAWCLGKPGVNGFSYLVAPWLVYPLAGFVLGSWYGRASPSERARVGGFALVVAALALSVSAVAHVLGASFWRWTTMSIAFFVLSVAILALTCLTSFFLVRELPSASNLLSMSGVSAFAAVPVHYALLAMFKPVLAPIAPPGYLAATMGVLALTLWIAHGVDIAVRRWRPAADASLMGPGLLALTVAAAAVVVWRAPQHHAMVGCLAQLVVVALFGWRSRPFGVWRMAR